MHNLSTLPLDLLSHIETFLDYNDFLQARKVSKNLKMFGETDSLWKQQCLSRFPLFRDLQPINNSWKERFKVCLNWEKGRCTQKTFTATSEKPKIVTIQDNSLKIIQENQTKKNYISSASYQTWYDNGIKIADKTGKILKTIPFELPAIPPERGYSGMIFNDQYLIWIRINSLAPLEPSTVFITNLQTDELWSFSGPYKECFETEDHHLIIKGDGGGQIFIVDPENREIQALYDDGFIPIFPNLLAVDGNRIFSLIYNPVSDFFSYDIDKEGKIYATGRIWDDATSIPREIEILLPLGEKFSPISIALNASVLFISYCPKFRNNTDGGIIQAVDIFTGKTLYEKYFPISIHKILVDNDRLIGHNKHTLVCLDFVDSTLSYFNNIFEEKELLELTKKEKPKPHLIPKYIQTRIYGVMLIIAWLAMCIFTAYKIYSAAVSIRSFIRVWLVQK